MTRFHRARHRRRLSSCLALAAALAACSPAWDWRTLHVPDDELAVSFPCKPDRQSRRVQLAGEAVTLQMLTCRAGGLSFGLSRGVLSGPLAAQRAVEAMHAAAARLSAGEGRPALPLNVDGMTPHPGAVRMHATGRRPDGSVWEQESATFMRGANVYQAVVAGDRLAADITETYFTALRFAP